MEYCFYNFYNLVNNFQGKLGEIGKSILMSAFFKGNVAMGLSLFTAPTTATFY